MKITRDPITMQPIIEIANQKIVIQKNIDKTPKEIMNQPANQVIECAL